MLLAAGQTSSGCCRFRLCRIFRAPQFGYFCRSAYERS